MLCNHQLPGQITSVRFQVTRLAINCNCNWGTCIANDQGRFTESICILVPIDRMKQKCFQITTKQVRLVTFNWESYQADEVVTIPTT